MIRAVEEIRYRVPDAPTIGRSLRDGAVDFYFNSWRLVPANVVWATMVLLIVAAALWWPPFIALAPLLALPVAGMFRMATLSQRGSSVAFGDFLGGMRRFAGPALALGIASTLAAGVFTANILLGVATGGLAGAIFAILAAYANLGLAMFLLAAWPILVDPLREDLTFGSRLRLAFLVVVTRAGRMLGLTLAIGLVLAISAVLFAALLTISMAYVALVASHYVLPAADRLEGRATRPIPA